MASEVSSIRPFCFKPNPAWLFCSVEESHFDWPFSVSSLPIQGTFWTHLELIFPHTFIFSIGFDLILTEHRFSPTITHKRKQKGGSHSVMRYAHGSWRVGPGQTNNNQPYSWQIAHCWVRCFSVTFLPVCHTLTGRGTNRFQPMAHLSGC